MSVQVSSWVWQHSKAKGAARLVLLALADHAGADGGDAYPSISRLCERCGLSERGVQDALRRLVASGEVVVYPQAGPRGTNRYRIPMTPAESAPHPRRMTRRPPQNLHPNRH